MSPALAPDLLLLFSYFCCPTCVVYVPTGLEVVHKSIGVEYSVQSEEKFSFS